VQGRGCGTRGRAPAALPLFSIFAIALAATRPCNADGTRVDLRVLPTYFSGDYGTGIDTKITYLPLILVVSSPRQEFRVTVPYLSIDTSQPVLYLNGEVIGPIPGGTTSQSGLGDIVAQEEVFFLQGTARRPWLSGIVRVKFPTADEKKGLGSGEYDYGAGLGIIQPAGRAWNILGTFQYVVRGDPPNVDFRNTPWLTIGAQWRQSAQSSWNLYYDRRRSVFAGNADLADLSAGYDRVLSHRVTFRSLVYAGLSTTSEDFGFGAGFSYVLGRR
jgi:hypothetical protein